MKRMMVVMLALLVLTSASASWTAVWLLNAAAESRAEQSERADARTEQLVDLLVEGRDEWSSHLQHIHETVDRLCAANPDC